jgi:hypothetical protein
MRVFILALLALFLSVAALNAQGIGPVGGGGSNLGYTPLSTTNNLSDVVNSPAANDNLVGTHPAPTYTDDSTFGHAVADLWTNPNDGDVYQAQEVGVGQASWTKLPTGRPIDLVGWPVITATVSAGGSGYAVNNTITMPNGTVLKVATISGSAVATVTIPTPGNWGCNTPSNPVAQSSSSGGGTGATFTLGLGGPGVAYGTSLLTNCYSGSALQLSLVNGPTTTTKTIAFLANGQIDAATADAFCGPSPLTCYVTTWYDQSGNGLNATQSAGATAPIWSVVNNVNGFRPVVFNSNPHALGSGLTVATTKYLTIGSGLSWTPSSSTYVFAGRFPVSVEGRVIFQNTGGTLGIASSADSGLYQGMAVQGVAIKCGLVVDNDPAVAIVSWSSSAYLCWSNNSTASSSASSQSGQTGALLGSSLTVSSASAPNVSNWDGLAAIVYTRNLLTTEITNARVGLASLFNIQMQAGDELAIDGDSMSMGEGSSYDYSQWAYALPSIRKNVKMINTAVYGADCTGGSGREASFSTNGPGKWYSSTARNFIIHLIIGPNDVRIGQTATQIEACLQSYVQAAQTLGTNVKVIIGIPPLQCDIFNSGTELPVWTALWNWVLANYNVLQTSGGLNYNGQAVIVANYWADPTIGVGGATASSAFCSATYSADSTQHANDFGMQFFVSAFADAVNSLLH